MSCNQYSGNASKDATAWFTHLSRKLQASFPKEAVEAPGLRPANDLRAEAVGPGEIRFVPATDSLDLLDELACEFAGRYPPGYLEDLRNEWATDERAHADHAAGCPDPCHWLVDRG